MKKLVLLIILIVGLGYLALTNPDTDDAKVFYAQQQGGETDSGENNLMNSIWGLWVASDQEDVYRENYVFFSLYDFGNECHLIGIAGFNFYEVPENVWDSTSLLRGIVQKAVNNVEENEKK